MRAGRIASFVIFLLAALLSRPLHAQSAGSLTGRVVDSTGNPLPGARISIEALGRTTSADRDGHFLFSALPIGPVTIRAGYIGFRPGTVTVTVKGGVTLTADLVLERIATALPEITVKTSRSRGEVKALNQQQDAENIVNVIPSEIITSLPNTNVADAVGRVPGVTLERDEGEGKYVQIRGTEPRLTNLTIDGVRVPNPESSVRNAKLDIIPSELVGSIEVHKTLQPDMEGDAIGGSVNLVTRAAEDHPFLIATGYGGVTDLQGGVPLYQGAVAFGKRFGAERKFGLSLGGSYDYNARGIDDIEPSVGSGSFNGVTQPIVPTAIDLREYAYYRRRAGFAGQMDYKFSPSSMVFLKGLFSNFQNYGDRWVTSLSPGGFNQSPTISDTTGEVDKTVQQRRPNEQVWSLLAGGNHDLGGGVLLDYGASLSRAQQLEEGYFNASWATDAGANPIAFTADPSNPNRPKLNVANGVNINDPTAYQFTGYNVTNSRTFDRSVAGRLNLTIPYTIGSGPGAFKFGGAVRDELKVNNADETYYVPTDAGGPNLSQVLSSFSNPNYYSGAYTLGPLADANAVKNFIAANPGDFTVNVNKTRAVDGQSYRVTEKVYAVYLMDTQRFGDVDVMAGVRVENTKSGYTGNNVVFDNAGNWVSTTPVTGGSNYTNVLPSASLKYMLDRQTNIRAAFGEGIARPNFSDLPPYVIENDRSKSISVGNSDLKPTRAHNFDVMMEHYFTSVGVISAGAFYKDLFDYIGPNQTVVASGPFAGYTQVQQINLPKAHVLGVELAWQQHLYFLPGALGGLGILANYTFNDSKAVVPGRTDDPRLLRTSPSQWNVGLTYDRGGFSGRIAAQHNGASIYAYNYAPGADLGPTGPNGDVYLLARTQVDAQVSYRFAESGLQIFSNVLNLNNSAFGFYQGSPQYLIQREFYGPTFTLGVRLTR